MFDFDTWIGSSGKRIRQFTPGAFTQGRLESYQSEPSTKLSRYNVRWLCCTLKRCRCNLKRVMLWYFEDGGVVLWRKWCGTLQRVVWYFEEGGVVLWRGWCSTLKMVVWYSEENGLVLWRGWYLPTPPVRHEDSQLAVDDLENFPAQSHEELQTQRRSYNGNTPMSSGGLTTPPTAGKRRACEYGLKLVAHQQPQPPALS